jgi:hypothetical protein
MQVGGWPCGGSLVGEYAQALLRLPTCISQTHTRCGNHIHMLPLLCCRPAPGQLAAHP